MENDPKCECGHLASEHRETKQEGWCTQEIIISQCDCRKRDDQVRLSAALARLERVDAIVAAQADIIREYTRHRAQCYSTFRGPETTCVCGLSAALAALRKLQGDAP